MHQEILELVEKIKDNADGKMIATAESCTGGLLASYLTSIAGASVYFSASIITYSNESKIELLGVNADDLQEYGAVSEEVAEQMAYGCAQKTKAGIAVAITGVAGPDGGSVDKPVGTVCFAIAFEEEVKSWKILFEGDRDEIRQQACKEALQALLVLLNN